ncbi:MULTISPECIES: protein bax [Atlantibacter]|uniref:Bax protein n=2 Tax=Atlantibacter hermannii TaxID=565 RepID=H5V1K4_ATLHE|nr:MULTISPECIES: protein bax [Atlantibacter]MCQ4967754.1 protein bax [Enterobacteriaceae bacterium DFI.7.85]HAI51198.1 protein bax [Enterobacteriaceae bacterium]MBW9429322.1 protein bax [Atlantibacter hermannii]MDQ7882248.1 protein bax [Atlantibacter hermannii]MDU1951971.1 protein bax [Atlantibacter hermannii]
MKSTRLRRIGAAILIFFTFAFSGGVLAKQHKTTSHTAQIKKTSVKHQASSKKEYSRNSEISGSLPDLRKYPSGTPRKKAFLRTVMPYITSQNAVITAERNWLISKQYEGKWSPAERARLKKIAQTYKISWNGNTKRIPWNTLLERVDIIPTSMVATMAAAESGWGTSKLARSNNNLFGMKCTQRKCNSQPGKVKGYSHFGSVKESVSAYVVNLNTHPAYASFRKSRAQLRKADQELTATNMIHKLKGYSTKGRSYNNYLFSMYQDNQRLLAANM